MDHHAIINFVLFLGIFFFISSVLQAISRRYSFIPYTVALLVSGFVSQIGVKALHLDFHFSLPTDIIYFIVLPLLLFGSAIHINYHQFKLQFKTISFLSTFGLLVSIFVIATMLALILKLPWGAAFLFGAIISATDPIAVLSLFQVLGAPKRLALLADGESMFNDATAVIAFRVISGFVIVANAFEVRELFVSAADFLYVFFGSILFGAVISAVFSHIIARIKNDRIVETTLMVALAFMSFVMAEYFFHLSGVISCVIAGIVLGNYGKTKISPQVVHFAEGFWDYIGFMCVSFVFFFSTYSLEAGIFTQHIAAIPLVIATVLIARSASVYISCFLSNKLRFFKDEPNVPLSWQHILNWGGLRGVIPLVLVYSLPDTYQFKDEMLAFTMSSFLFTLFINGLTIRSLLMSFGLHLPRKEEEIIQEEFSIFELDDMKNRILNLPNDEFDKDLITEYSLMLSDLEKRHKEQVMKIAKPEEVKLSLKLQAIEIERNTLYSLFSQGFINEGVYGQFISELDLQQDAIEYPEVANGRGVKKGGFIKSQTGYTTRLATLHSLMKSFPGIGYFFKDSEETIIKERFSLLKARIFTSKAVVQHFERVEKSLNDHKLMSKLIQEIKKEHQYFIEHNQTHLDILVEQHENLIKAYQRKMIYSYVYSNNVNVYNELPQLITAK